MKILLFYCLFILFTVDNARSQALLWSKKANPISNSINGVSFRSDGQKVIAGTNCHPASIRIFDVSNSTLDWDYNVSESFMCIMGVTFSANSNYIVAIEEFGNLFLFDNRGNTPILTDTIVTGTTYGFATSVSPDNTHIAVGCSNGKLKVYTLPGGELIQDLSAHPNWVTTVAYSPDGNFLVSGGSDDKVRVWDRMGKMLFTCADHKGDVTQVKVSPDNKWIISAGKDDVIKIWNAKDGLLVRTLMGHKGDVNGIDISPDGLRLVSGAADKTCKIWELSTGALLSTFGVPENGSVTAVAWSPKGDRIASGNIISDLMIWQVDATVSQRSLELSTKAKIYPNPGNSFLTIELNPSVQLDKITIADFSGKQVWEKAFNGTTTYDLSHLPKGAYQISGFHNNTKLWTQRWLKQ
jgi:WD40 repeat protein